MPKDSFVKVQNQRLTIDGKPFYFAGWNIWEVLEGTHASLCGCFAIFKVKRAKLGDRCAEVLIHVYMFVRDIQFY